MRRDDDSDNDDDDDDNESLLLEFTPIRSLRPLDIEETSRL